MKNKKIPMRICIVSREKLPKSELMRIVLTPDGEIVVDDTGKINGHGAYIKKSLEIVDKLHKSKMLDKLFEQKIDDAIYDDLKTKIN